MGDDWTRLEVEAVVADYFSMFVKELKLEPYSKSAHRHALAKLLKSRSDGSIEFKHQNISAVLIDLGYPYIAGYKPKFNYQQLLLETIKSLIASNKLINKTVSQSVEAPAIKSQTTDILTRLVLAPDPQTVKSRQLVAELKHNYGIATNYLERETRNSSLGLAGEEFVLEFERARLVESGRLSLADKIEHTSVTEGDGVGFDIRSFEINGADRLIEVKTTAYGKQTPFFVSRNELNVSKIMKPHYHVFRVFEFRNDPKLFILSGSIEESCKLEAVSYVARIG
ncbi:MAG: DUF3883 domain-containing protein [Candidatus Delongbacteria bacterium]